MATQSLEPAVVVDLATFRLEPHVEEAFERAWQRGGGQALGADQLLEACLALARESRSRAFAKLVELIPATVSPPKKRVPVAPLEKAAVPFRRPLARSFFVAEGFLTRKKGMWGRDLVTLALLSEDDPALQALVVSAGRTLADVRQEWLHFLRSSGQHRPWEEWEEWWRAAGVPVSDAQEEVRAPPVAYLMTWNPTLYPPSKMEEFVTRLEARGSAEFSWSTGNRRTMEVGARVFLIRQGVEPRGLVGVGVTTGEVEQAPHWRPEERERGKTSNLVEVRWDALATEPFLDRSGLVSLTGDEALWSSAAGGVEIDPLVQVKLEPAWRGAWARRQGGLDQPMSSGIESRRWIAGFDADRWRADEKDTLHIDRYVNAFARVMASRTLQPPLSIGLFGDWGSGKTFFMERLRRRVDEFSASADEHEPPLYWPHICQIGFNAWHYAETDLWASLVSTIFNNLRTHLDGEVDEGDEFNKLLNRLELATELRKENEERWKKAQERLTRASREVAEAKERLTSLEPPEPLSDQAYRAVLTQTLAEASGWNEAEIESLVREAAEISGNPHLERMAAGFAEGRKTVQDTRILLAETRDLFSRVGFWWRVLSTATLHRSPWFWVVVATALALPVGFFFLQSFVGVAVGWAAVLSETLLVAGSAVAWCRNRLAAAAPVFDRLDLLQTSVERRLEKARNKDLRAHEARVAEAEIEAEEARRKLEEARSELGAAREAEKEARVALKESTSQARLGKFIRERAASADYEKYLGLIAMIHRDFSRLSDLMEAARQGKADPDLPRLDRIVLYIDDLDRCYPPDKVVRVLEAVHLLLFFPLFVVVVGVDSRWVSRALNRYYEGMLADESVADEPGRIGLHEAPADSQDFLEKIFQVPFWLRRMDSAAVKRMIHGLIAEEEIEVADAPTPEAGTGIEPEEDGSMGMSLELDAEAEQDRSPGKERPGVASTVQRITLEAEGEVEFMGEPLAEIPTETLRITEGELRFMDAVAPLMPRTPRSVKRFVNIYRLYKSALSPAGFGTFMGTPERPGNYRAVQVLLALVTGTPAFAKAVVDALEHTDGTAPSDLGGLAESDFLSSGKEESWTKTLEALREFARGPNNLELDELRAVSRLVCRFSVHNMVGRNPGEPVLS